MNISKLTDKIYIKYTKLFNYKYNKFMLINEYILYNYYFSNNKICNIDFIDSPLVKTYSNIILKKGKYFISNNYDNLITIYKNTSDYLLITNYVTIILNNYGNKKNIDTIFYYNVNYNSEYDITKVGTKHFVIDNLDKIRKDKNINSDLNICIEKSIYLNFLKNLKNNIIIKKKYNLISCHYGYSYGLSLSASYKMLLEIPNIISTIAMALKYIDKNGTLLLVWAIINVNIPIIKQILSILSYGFKNVEIIDNNINQNILIGVPEYYIKCTGYKDNIKDELINKLIDISIKTIDYNYNVCDVLDYYYDYTMKHPNNSLFYNKIDNKHDKIYHKFTLLSSSTKKSSSITKSSFSTRKSKQPIKPVKQIYYIENLELSEIDTIMKDKTI